MKQKMKIIPSGISLVDNTWGGFYRGGTYLLIGPRKSGRTLLGLQYAMETAMNKEVCLYFTSMRPKDLIIHAASIDFDLQSYMNQNQIIVVRVAPPTDLYEVGNNDDFLVEYLRDIVTVVDQYAPNRIIFDELTPFIGFENLNLLQSTFLETIEIIEDRDITSMYVLGEPANPVSQNIVNLLVESSTGTLYLQKKSEDDSPFQGGRIIITPNIGHTEGQFSANYRIEPNKGVSINIKESSDPHKSSPSIKKPGAGNETDLPKSSGKDKRFKSLSNIDVQSESVPAFTNLYDINDFSLILNNQIALYKSTGQIFTFIVFKLEQEADKLGILTINQLQNAVRLSTDRKDKICVQDNRVMVLVTKEEQKGLSNIVSKIKSNLPGSSSTAAEVFKYISVMTLQVDDTIQNAESILNLVLADES